MGLRCGKDPPAALPRLPQVFSTNITKDRETSFDHPNLPAIVNPFNTHNKMSYSPGALPPLSRPRLRTGQAHHPGPAARRAAHAGSCARAGVKLSWYLGSKQWDLVHLVYPSNIGVCVLPVCAWRRIAAAQKPRPRHPPPGTASWDSAWCAPGLSRTHPPRSTASAAQKLAVLSGSRLSPRPS